MKEFTFSKVTAKNKFDLKRTPFTCIFQGFSKNVLEHPFIKTPRKNAVATSESSHQLADQA